MTKEALRLALEAFNDLAAWNDGEVGSHMDEPYSAEIAREAITAIKKALAQPEQAPMNYYRADAEGNLERTDIHSAQPEQEPFEYWNAVEGWVKIDEVREHFDSVGCGTIYKTAGEGREPLYTTPPQRTWVGLTDKEIEEIWKIAMFTDYGIGAELSNQPFVHYAKAIEAKLKERNS